MTYGFRLKFRISPHTFISSKEQEVELGRGIVDRPFILKESVGVKNRESAWWVITGSGCCSDEEACTEGLLAKTALLLAGAECQLGIDCGNDEPIGRMTEHAKRSVMESAPASEIVTRLPDVHGLTTFNEQENVRFVSVGASGSGELSSDAFVRKFDSFARLRGTLSNRERTALELIHSAKFETSNGAKLVLSITAIEALCPRGATSSHLRSAVESLADQLDNFEELSGEDRDRIQGRLLDMRRQSTRSSCMQKIAELMGGEQMFQFDKLYKERNNMVHRGKQPSGADSLEAQSLAWSLLKKMIFAG